LDLANLTKLTCKLTSWGMKEVQFFRRADGSSPVEEFIDGLTDKQAQKVAWVLKLIEAH